MNILFTITYYHPYVSGLSICAKRIAEGLVSTGHQVSVLAMRHDSKMPEKETIHGVQIQRSNVLFRVNKGFISHSYIFDAFRSVSSADTILCNIPQPESIIPAIFGKVMGKKVVVLYHCELELPPGIFNRLIQFSTDILHLMTLSLCNHVIVYTTDYADASRLLQFFKKKIIEIRPPVPMSIVDRKQMTEIRKQIGRVDVVIGVAARLAREKGIEYLVDALPVIRSRFPKDIIKIVLAGPMDPVGEDEYKAFIEKKVMLYSDQIVFLGTIPSEHMAAFYRNIDILAVPSVNRTEAFGLVQIEAMREGIPVVVSDLPGVRVPVKETGMGLVVPLRDSQAIATAIIQLIQSGTRKKHAWDTRHDPYQPSVAIARYEEVLVSL